MKMRGDFEDIKIFDAKEHGLMRDLFVGFKARGRARVSSAVTDAESRVAVPDTTASATLLTPLADVSAYDEPKEIVRRVAPLMRRLFTGDNRNEYFRLFEEQGLHVTPVDSYEPIPDTRRLPDSLWGRESEMVGVDMNVDAQLQLICDVFPAYAEEYTGLPTRPTADPGEFYLGNGIFDGTDALSYYCMVRHFEPRTVIQIGSGFATRVAATAAARNPATPEVLVVDPRPDHSMIETLNGQVSLIEASVENTEMTLYERLQSGDILFIDSSHVIRIGGDVTFLFLEVVPRLKTGVLVHVHDIFLPRAYPKDWVLEKARFWNEQYLLQAFLLFNTDFEVLLCNAYLGTHHQPELRDAFPNSPWWGGGSWWMRRRSRECIGDGTGDRTDSSGSGNQPG